MAHNNVVVDFDGVNITFQKGGAHSPPIDITNLSSLLNPAVRWPGADEFIMQQEYINYLDTIKDGKIVTSKKSSLAQGTLLGQITVTPPMYTPDGAQIAGAPLPQHVCRHFARQRGNDCCRRRRVRGCRVERHSHARPCAWGRRGATANPLSEHRPRCGSVYCLTGAAAQSLFDF